MLAALAIRDFAIIDRVELDFSTGLTVVTGETGAGKSILINALKLVLGGRAATDVIRAGADQAHVEALFHLGTAQHIRAQLELAGLDARDEFVVRRVISRNGRHRVYVNGSLATLGMLGRLTAGLVDISGQHEHYSLLRTDTHLDLLDRVAGLSATRAAVGEAHDCVAALDARRLELIGKRRHRAEREDFVRFQIQELEDAKLDAPDEDETLDLEAQRLGSAERLRGAAADAEQTLYADRGSAVERLDRAARLAADLAAVDPTLSAVAEDLETARVLTEDAARTLGSYGRNITADPDRLEEIETRLGLFSRLRRKYGATIAELIDRRDALRAELDAFAHVDDALELIDAERAAAASTLVAAAERLSAARRAGAAAFTEAVAAELADLGMAGARLEVVFTPVASGVEVDGRFVGARGADRVEYHLSANPGSPPQPIHRIASGGELSRFMLAVKRIIAENDPVGCYIFDEVDTGVGGPTADAIGRKLKNVSLRRQAICITHLPQIAAFADHHFRVEKQVDGERTQSRVCPLARRDRVDELARMLGGARITAKTRAHARELIHHASVG